ncbi:hypothetical protein CDAR_200531 [Caerostris darwini]|uniref:Uncharacterized protein n=1 Tax=Caerostris darwini TaxID=1538125 RepID=A0AAV4TZ00_9ARAC|nr:hypothetical protein CDAR_200531 [Caerostris darwini]
MAIWETCDEEHGHNKDFQEHHSKVENSPRAHSGHTMIPAITTTGGKCPIPRPFAAKWPQSGVASFSSNVSPRVTKGRDSVQLERSKLRLN